MGVKRDNKKIYTSETTPEMLYAQMMRRIVARFRGAHKPSPCTLKLLAHLVVDIPEYMNNTTNPGVWSDSLSTLKTLLSLLSQHCLYMNPDKPLLIQ
jgi:hypothetical protein